MYEGMSRSQAVWMKTTARTWFFECTCSVIQSVPAARSPLAAIVSGTEDDEQ